MCFYVLANIRINLCNFRNCLLLEKNKVKSGCPATLHVKTLITRARINFSTVLKILFWLCNFCLWFETAWNVGRCQVSLGQPAYDSIWRLSIGIRHLCDYSTIFLHSPSLRSNWRHINKTSLIFLGRRLKSDLPSKVTPWHFTSLDRWGAQQAFQSKPRFWCPEPNTPAY